jgi:uncharacterized protein (DUF362 family)
MRIPARPRVILRHCDRYDVATIRRIVREGMEALGIVPEGKTLVKPNCVSSGEQFLHAYTRPEFLEGVLLAIQDRDAARDDRSKPMTELAVGERCGITIPTRMAFEGAGYYPMFERTRVKHYHFEEEPQVEIPLTHPGRLRDYLFTPEPVAKADTFINCPKFKSHPWTTVTFSMKNYIGIQDDRHRLIDHDHRLDEKIRDLQFIVQPKFIAIDCIVAGEGRMLTPKPRQMSLILIGNSQAAIDAVGCHILGLDPRSVDHLRLAEEAGFGSLDLATISVEGDVPLEEAQRRAAGFQVGLIRVEKYFEGTNVTAYAGPPPEKEKTDYCWGGCPGALEESIEILRQYDSECDEKMPRVHIVFGAYEGPIPRKAEEPIVFIGDCATYDGESGGRHVHIDSLYKDRRTKDPYSAKHDDIYAKMISLQRVISQGKKDGNIIRLAGCPVSVSEQVLMFCALSKIKNPILDPSAAVDFNKAYISWRAKMVEKKLLGKPYQIHGATSRGEGAPQVERPAPIAKE